MVPGQPAGNGLDSLVPRRVKVAPLLRMDRMPKLKEMFCALVPSDQVRAMSDPVQRLQHTLENLQRELDRQPRMDPQVRESLQHTLDELQATLATKTAPTAEQHESLLGRLRTAAEHFEEEHPQLTGTLGSIIEALRQLGI